MAARKPALHQSRGLKTKPGNRSDQSATIFGVTFGAQNPDHDVM
jgi:hypothetical protein